MSSYIILNKCPLRSSKGKTTKKKKKERKGKKRFPYYHLIFQFGLGYYITPIQDFITLSTLKFRAETRLHLEATFIKIVNS